MACSMLYTLQAVVEIQHMRSAGVPDKVTSHSAFYVERESHAFNHFHSGGSNKYLSIQSLHS